MHAHSWHKYLSELYFNTTEGLKLWQQFLVAGSLFIVSLILAVIAHLLVKKLVTHTVQNIVRMTKNTWDDELMSSRIFLWFSSLTSVAILWHLAPFCFDAADLAPVKSIGTTIRIICEILIVIFSLLIINSILNVINRIYIRYEVSKDLPIKVFIQVVKIILTLVGMILIISAMVNKSPVLIFSGLGAMTAILILVFKDSLLGLVAGIQLSANRMVARGDWIEMPKFSADGEVMEVALTTVKIRNWDKTITTIPTYALISDSFKNWRGMSSSGVRRIKRSINLDINQIKFLEPTLLQRLKKFSLLQHYIQQKEQEIKEWNLNLREANQDPINSRAMTNLGTFRTYVIEYLKNHPKISKTETLLVRQLQPSQNGIPIEIYAFTTDNGWVNYESIQADIFDHLFAVLKEFHLQAFQRPSGLDFSKTNPND